MFEVGQKVRFTTVDDDKELFTIAAVSPHVEMVRFKGENFWAWTDHLEIVEQAPFIMPNQIIEQLRFLGM